MENSKNIFKGVGLSFLLTLVLLFIFSIILVCTNISENTITPVIIIATAVSILFGSSLSTIHVKKNGMVNGGIVGMVYLLIIYSISSILNWRFSLNIQSIITIIIGIVFGMIGGVIGINRK